MTGDSRRAEREDQLRSSIAQEVEDFRAQYEPLTSEELAWSHAVTAWLPLWQAWASHEPDGTPPPVPSLDIAMLSGSTIGQKNASGRAFQEKYWGWRRLHARALGHIAGFTAEYLKAADEERVWASRVAQDGRTLLDASLGELMLVHPDMRRIHNIDTTEILRALLGVGEYADDNDLDDDDLDDDDFDDDDFDDDDFDDDEDSDGREKPLS